MDRRLAESARQSRADAALNQAYERQLEMAKVQAAARESAQNARDKN